jgi:hypothetical protein
MTRAKQTILYFLFAPASPLPLASLRIGVSAILITQAFFIMSRIGDFYGKSSLLLQEPMMSGGLGLNIPSILNIGARFGFSEGSSLFFLGVIYLTSLVCFLIGWKTRVANIIAWFIHLIWMNEQPTAYGTDFFAHVSLFLMIWMPTAEVLSVDAISGSKTGEKSSAARLSLRMFQFYLCIAYLASGLEKMAGEQWWNGEAVWRSIMLPSLQQYDMSWVAFYPILAKLACWGTLLAETGYAFFVWPKATRKIWIALIIGLHLGIALFMGLWLFSLIMIILNIGAFIISPETQPIRMRAWSAASLRTA